jgi:DNA-directed RNA polymerase alpha subunit
LYSANSIELAELKRIKNVENIDVTLSEEQEKRMRLLKTSIRDLNLSRRALNTLVDYDIQHKNMKTLGDIATRTVKEIRSIYNLGYHTYIELSDVIEHYGLCWNIDIDYFILTGNVNVKIKEG